MRERRPYFTTAAAAAVLTVAALAGTSGCGTDRVTADARRTLGTQLGAIPGAGTTGTDRRQSASADDLAAARRYLEATLRLDPTNEGARAALAGLGGPSDVDPALVNLTPTSGPVASRAAGARTSASFGEVAVGAVGAITSDLAQAVGPVARTPALVGGRSAADSTHEIMAIVSPSADSAGRAAARPPRSHSTGVRRRDEVEPATAIAARDDSTRAPDAKPADADRSAATQPAKHKRTWPWTRAQRWLVAKGIGAGGGAGVVVGALVGNVPGALLAGSLTGGALGFHKATKIGPAAPYPSKSDSVAFDANHRRRDTEKSKKAPADTGARVAVAHR